MDLHSCRGKLNHLKYIFPNNAIATEIWYVVGWNNEHEDD
jgi:hypothetical protein